MKKLLVLVAAVAMVGAACKKSVAGEKSKWEQAQKDLAEAVTQYPNLKALLVAKETEAKAIMADAEKITKDEEKAEKMDLAIKKLNENLGVVVEIKYKLKNIDDTIGKITKLKTTADRAKRATSEISAIRDEQNSIEKEFSALKPANSEELNTQAREIVGKIISLQGRADRTLKLVKGK